MAIPSETAWWKQSYLPGAQSVGRWQWFRLLLISVAVFAVAAVLLAVVSA